MKAAVICHDLLLKIYILMHAHTHKYIKHFKGNNCLLDITEEKRANDEIWMLVMMALTTHWKGR